jgi:hypothetical protein
VKVSLVAIGMAMIIIMLRASWGRKARLLIHRPAMLITPSASSSTSTPLTHHAFSSKSTAVLRRLLDGEEASPVATVLKPGIRTSRSNNGTAVS